MTATAAAATWRVPRMFEGQTVTVVAGGPSLTDADVLFAAARGPVVAVNTAYRLMPSAAVLYGADGDFWKLHWPAVCRLPAVKLTCSAPDSAAVAAGLGIGVVEIVQGAAGAGLSRDPSRIHGNSNSGAQAINIATLAGAWRVLLLGFDMRRGADGAAHWHGDHIAGLRNPAAGVLEGWAKLFPAIAASAADLGIEIINCSRETALDCFPRAAIDTIGW